MGVNSFDQAAAARYKGKNGKRPREEECSVEVGDEVYYSAHEVATVVKVKSTPDSERGPFKYSLVDRDGNKIKTRNPLVKTYLGMLRGASPPCVVAPMVGGSELAFRLLCRRYGAQVAYTPMMHASEFAEDADYRKTWLQCHESDRPLIAHFCANDPEHLARACELAAPRVDGVDLNLGCPQRVAYSGHFGSYLLGTEDRELVKRLVSSMKRAVSLQNIPVCVKIRLLDTLEDTVQLVKDLRDSGADVVAIHGRKRATWHKRGPGARDGPADLEAVREVRRAVEGISIVTNGNVRSAQDISSNLEFTGANGIMVAEALLNNPALLTAQSSSSERLRRQIGLALEYLELVRVHGNPAGYRSIAFHVRRIAADALVAYDSMDDLLDGSALLDAVKVVEKCRDFASGRVPFQSDPDAKKKAAERKKKREEAKKNRKRFEERLVRKAKRENKPLDTYLKKGAEPPTPEQITEIRDLADQGEKMERWKRDFGQICFNFVFGSCSRGETCAFLHARHRSEDEDDLLVSG